MNDPLSISLTQVSDAALAVPLHQNVAAFEVTVGDGRLALSGEDFCVKVHQATGYWQAHAQTRLWIQGAVLQEVIKWAQLMEMSHQPELRAGVLWCHVWGDESWKKRLRDCNTFLSGQRYEMVSFPRNWEWNHFMCQDLLGTEIITGMLEIVQQTITEEQMHQNYW